MTKCIGWTDQCSSNSHPVQSQIVFLFPSHSIQTCNIYKVPWVADTSLWVSRILAKSDEFYCFCHSFNGSCDKPEYGAGLADRWKAISQALFSPVLVRCVCWNVLNNLELIGFEVMILMWVINLYNNTPGSSLCDFFRLSSDESGVIQSANRSKECGEIIQWETRDLGHCSL